MADQKLHNATRLGGRKPERLRRSAKEPRFWGSSIVTPGKRRADHPAEGSDGPAGPSVAVESVAQRCELERDRARRRKARDSRQHGWIRASVGRYLECCFRCRAIEAAPGLQSSAEGRCRGTLRGRHVRRRFRQCNGRSAAQASVVGGDIGAQAVNVERRIAVEPP